MMRFGYIYIRRQEQYDMYNACKLGKTLNIPDRDTQYAVSELKRGHFQVVLEVNNNQLDAIETALKCHFAYMNIRFDAGTEFFDTSIIDKIEDFLAAQSIAFRALSKDEIETLRRAERNNTQKPAVSFTPRPYQADIIQQGIEHLKVNDKGILCLVCGSGKTPISLWISVALDCKRMLVGVPNILLINQWKLTIENMIPNPNVIIVDGNRCMDDIISITKPLKEFIVITTYASSYKIKDSGIAFDMKILDEAHHVTTNNLNRDDSSSQKRYIDILGVPSRYQLSLTATLKTIDSNADNVISNNNKAIFGDIIAKRSLLWGIQHQVVCDYNIQTIISSVDVSEFHKKDDELDKQLAISAYCALLSLKDEHTHHLLIYTNNINNCNRLVELLHAICRSHFKGTLTPCISSYDSEMPRHAQDNIITAFKSSKLGIIGCVYCLGEGWDLPLLDGVVFAENMTSNIRIVQSSLRASRKDKNDPNKVSKIIIPVADIYNDECDDMKRIRRVVRDMGIEDEMILERMKVYKAESNTALGNLQDGPKDSIAYDDALTAQLKLRTITRQVFGVGFKKAKEIIAAYKIESIEEYMALCDKDCRLTREPEVTYKGYFTNWVDYLSVPRKYYDLHECKMRIREMGVDVNQTISVHEVSRCCKERDDRFPPIGLWTDYYGVNKIDDIIDMIDDIDSDMSSCTL